MRTLIQPEVKLKTSSLNNLTYQVKEESSKSKFDLNYKFYQRLFLILLAASIFLIFPESPKNSEALCKKFNSSKACMVW